MKVKAKPIEPMCEYCERAHTESGTLICSKKGEVSSDDSCKKFKYDPLKRVPRKPKLNTDFSAKDFEI